MKTLTPTNIIALEVPKDSEDFKIIVYADNKKALLFIVNQPGYYETGYINLGELDLEILGEFTDTEFSFDVELPNKNFVGRTVYKNFNNPESGFFETKEESFRSLLRFNEIYFKNPIGKTPNILRDSENSWTSEQYKEWQSYESKLIKGKLIILKQK